LLQAFLPFNTKDTKDTKVRFVVRPNETSHAVIASALEVHTAIGAGVLESKVFVESLTVLKMSCECCVSFVSLVSLVLKTTEGTESVGVGRSP
jgi:hypothetical protein